MAVIEKIKHLLKDKDKMRELITYVIFGILTTGVNWAVYMVVREAFGLEQYEEGSLPYLLITNGGNALAWILSVLFAFFTNKRVVFRSKKGMQNGARKEFFLFVSARVASYVIFDVLLFNALGALGVHDKADKLIMNVLVVIFNYLASRYVIFKQKREENEAKEAR